MTSPNTHISILQTSSMGICMKGKIYPQMDRRRWMVYWYDVKSKKGVFITKYHGEFMPFTAFQMKNGSIVLDKKNRPIPDKDKCYGYEIARKLRAEMQHRWQQHQKGECAFRIEEFTREGWTDTVEWYNKWIDEKIVPTRKPGTIKGYRSYAKTWIEPFFSKHPVRLHEIENDTLLKLLNFIIDGLKNKTGNCNPKTTLILKTHEIHPEMTSMAISEYLEKEHNLEVSESWIRRVIAKSRAIQPKNTDKKTKNFGKTALNILSSVHSMMDYAHRSKRILAVPPFPKLEDYNLKARDIEYLTPEEFNKVYAAIPAEHIPIFLFLRLHYRRPGEACAIHKTDFDPINACFKIHRAISARELVDSVKTNWKKPKMHLIDCDPDFIPIAIRLLKENTDSPFLFVNSRARKKGGRYTLESIKNIWYSACDDAGVRRIWPYRGLKHTACMKYIEDGGTEDSLMILTDHASRQSVQQYFEVTLRRKKMARAEAKRRAELSDRNGQPLQNLDNVIPFNRK